MFGYRTGYGAGRAFGYPKAQGESGPVVTFARDFNAETVGDNITLPDDFTYFANGQSSSEWDIATDAGAVGGKALRLDTESGNAHWVTWDTPGSNADVEYVMQVKSSDMSNSSVQGAHTMLRAAQSSVDFISQRFLGGGTGQRGFYSIVGSTYNALSSHSRTTDTGWWWIRCQVIGDSYRFRYWKPANQADPGADEPGTWDVTEDLGAESPTPPSAGYVAFGGRESSSNDLYLGYISVSIEPGTTAAPLPA